MPVPLSGKKPAYAPCSYAHSTARPLQGGSKINIRPRLEGWHRSPDYYIINIDQMPVYHAMFSGCTIDRVEVRTVNLRASKGSADSKRVTVAACITASGRQIKSMVVFKGELRE